MKKALIPVLIIAAAATIFVYSRSGTTSGGSQAPAASRADDAGPLTVEPLSHATMVLTFDGVTVYVDPIGGADAFAGRDIPDIVLVSDIHGDHLDADTIGAVLGDGTSLIAPPAVIAELPEALAERATALANDDRATVNGIAITAMPMYNLPERDDAPHVKGRGNGYLLEKDGFRAYLAGDTGGIPEMRALTDIDVAFVPMNLPYTMTVEEAADAVLDFAPAKVYPYHYRGKDGYSDVGRFKDLVDAGGRGIEVVQLEWYPDAR